MFSEEDPYYTLWDKLRWWLFCFMICPAEAWINLWAFLCQIQVMREVIEAKATDDDDDGDNTPWSID